MTGKEFLFGFTLSAALDSHFKTAFAGASTSILNLNKKMQECRDINKAVTAAFKNNTISAESYNNALKQSSSAYSILAEKQSKLLGIQARINSAQQGMIRHGMNFMQYAAVWDKLKNVASAAIEFESSMADVRKVVDFDGAEQFKEMGNAILELSTRIPMTADGLAKIVAAGGQSGIARADLLDFAEAAAKMGVAFDITADQAGEMMAKWRTAFKMNQDQVVTLADQINYLGNTTAASAPKISEVVTRIGPLGEIGGVAAGEIAALGASMVGSGVESEVAATSIKNLILAMTAGESATKKQWEAFDELGINAEELAVRMQTDAKGAIVDFFTTLQSMDAAKRGAVLREIVGKESIEGLSGFLNNLDLLKENFGKVADAQRYAGSMQAEYDERSKTTANSLQLLENRQKAAEIQLTSGLLPVIVPVVEHLGEFAVKVGEIASEYPGVTTVIGGSIAIISGAGMAFSLLGGAIEGAKLAYNTIEFAVRTYRNAEILKTAQLYMSAVATKILSAAQWLLNTAFLGCPIVWIILGLAAIGAAAYLLAKNWDTVVAWISNEWEYLKNTASAVWDEICAVISNEWEYIKKVVTDGVNAAWDAISNFCNDIRRTFSEVFDWLSGKWEWISGVLSQPISTTVSAVFNSGKAETNAAGGIYSRGAFLTTFAEDSGESAIPHTPTARNIGLLARTNEIMGSPLGGNSYSIPISITVNGSADAGAASSIAAEVEAAVRRALANIENQKARVSYA